MFPLRTHDDAQKLPRQLKVQATRQGTTSLRRRYRICLLLVLTLMGLYLLAAGGKGAAHSTAPAIRTASVRTAFVSPPSPLPPHVAGGGQSFAGAGAGANPQQGSTSPTTASVTCLNPLDPSCWTQQIAQWMAGQIMNAIGPLIATFNASSLNILTQTPPADSYQNTLVVAFWTGFLQVVDIALATFIVIGGFNVMVGRQIGLSHTEMTEFLPRVILAVLAAHFSLYFSGLFIDLENALCSVALNLAGLSLLTTTIAAIFQGNLLGAGLLVWILALVVGVLDILLGVQMVVRFALLLVLIVLAGPGLACFALPQTLRFGRLWLSLFSATVMVQFFQVVALALGGVLLNSLARGTLLHLDSTLTTLFVSLAVLYLVLRLPGMLNTWALRPMMEASRGVTDTAEGAASTAARVLALM